MKTPPRAIIYPKDVQRITGKSERYGRKLLCLIRKKFHKEAHQFITVSEFATYTGIETEVIHQYMVD
jgi:hypothetical protein